MTNEDRKFVTEFGGECWHEENFNHPHGGFCVCGMDMLDDGDIFPCKNRTFTTPDDVYFLIDALKEKGYAPIGFRHWLSSNGYPILLDFMFIYTPAEQCQLIVDFLKEVE